MQLLLRDLIHRFYPSDHEVKLDRQGAFSSSAVVTFFGTFAAMNPSGEGYLPVALTVELSLIRELKV